MAHVDPGRGPAVTVVVICYNGSRFLREALDSVYAQTFPDWEVVFWDNGSTDGSAAIARAFGPRTRVFGGPHRIPLGAARNDAVCRSQGCYLAFLDVDDVWRPEMLERQVRRLSRGDASLVYSDCYVISRRGEVLGRYFQRCVPARGNVLGPLLDENFIPLPTVVVDRGTLLEAGGFDSRLRIAADYDLWLRIARDHPFDFDPAPLACYRIHEGNVTGDFRSAYRENLRVYRRQLRRADSGPASLRRRIRRALAGLHWKWAARELLSGGRPGRVLARLRAGWAQAASAGEAAAHAWWFMRRHLRGAALRYAMQRQRRGPAGR
ncbi:MAG: glycosyltransferase [Gemmatimonadetes bacterium]|nr:glycosyltransferase [Gemmatimonadota bacterium]